MPEITVVVDEGTYKELEDEAKRNKITVAVVAQLILEENAPKTVIEWHNVYLKGVEKRG